MYIFQGIFCTCFYVGCLTRLKVSDRVSRLRLVQENFVKRRQVLNVSFWKKQKNKKRGLRKAKKEKNTFWKTFSQIYFSFVWGLLYDCISTRRCKIRNWTYWVIQNNDQSSVCTSSSGWVAWASDAVCRLRLMQGNLVCIGYGSQVRFKRNKWFQS